MHLNWLILCKRQKCVLQIITNLAKIHEFLNDSYIANFRSYDQPISAYERAFKALLHGI